MDDLDTILAGLAHRPSHPRLEGLDATVAARIAADRRGRDLPLAASVALVAMALSMGVIGARVTAAEPSRQAVTLDAGLELAPSTRLVGAR